MEQREIKFRAINSEGEIIYGLPYTDGVNDTIYHEEYNNRLCWRSDKGEHCNQPYKNGTLMQYTGLKDKNGIEIYEGDIVRVLYTDWQSQSDYSITLEQHKINISNIGTVIYDHSGFVYHFWDKNKQQSLGSMIYGRHGECEIIGNIHQSPELL